MLVHALVGTEAWGCPSPLGDASWGSRYIAAAEASGGVVGSICDADWTPTLDAIGERAFSDFHTMALTLPAMAANLTVEVDGVPCLKVNGPTTNWIVDDASNSVQFTPDSECQPGPGQTVTISYAVKCT